MKIQLLSLPIQRDSALIRFLRRRQQLGDAQFKRRLQKSERLLRLLIQALRRPIRIQVEDSSIFRKAPPKNDAKRPIDSIRSERKRKRT